jgi:hypothetical protein
MDIRVAGKYRLTKKLGHGAFGDIYQGVNLKSGENVAIKLVSRRISCRIKINLNTVFPLEQL